MLYSASPSPSPAQANPVHRSRCMAIATRTGPPPTRPSQVHRTGRSARLVADLMTNRHRGATIESVSVSVGEDRRHGMTVTAVLVLVALTVAASVVAAAIDSGNHS